MLREILFVFVMLGLTSPALAVFFNYQDHIFQSELEEGEVYFLQPDQALKDYDSLINAAKLNYDSLAWAEALIGQGRLLNDQGDYHRSMTSFEEALKIYTKLQNNQGKAKCYLGIGEAFRRQNLNVEALEQLQTALDLFETVEANSGLAETLRQLGIVYKEQGANSYAITYFKQSLEMAESLKDSSGIASSFNSLGIAYNNLQDLSTALDYHEKALNIRVALKDWVRIAQSYNNIGNVYKEREEYDQAFEFYQKSLVINERLGNKSGLGFDYFYMGNIQEYIGEYDRALMYYRQSLTFRQDIGEMGEAAITMASIACVYFDLKQYDDAIMWAHRSFDESIALARPVLKKKMAELLAEILKAKGDYQKALEYFEVFKATSDSLTNLDNVKRIAFQELQFKFEQEKAEQELLRKQEAAKFNNELSTERTINYILLSFLGVSLILSLIILRIYLIKNRINRRLEQQNTAIASHRRQLETYSSQLKDALDEKEILLREVHHRVKNNLQIILSLLNSTSKKIEDRTAYDLIVESQNRLRSIAQIHDHLYQSDNFHRIEIKEFLPDVIRNVSRTFEQIKPNIGVTIDIKNTPINMNVAIPIGLIANELITNAYKHAFPQATGQAETSKSITISLKPAANGQYCLHVFDNGVGIAKTILSNLTNSVGLSLVKGLTDQIEGRLEISTSKGSSFQVFFHPDPNQEKSF